MEKICKAIYCSLLFLAGTSDGGILLNSFAAASFSWTKLMSLTIFPEEVGMTEEEAEAVIIESFLK